MFGPQGNVDWATLSEDCQWTSATVGTPGDAKTKTTVMLRNLPKHYARYTRELLWNFVFACMEGFFGLVNFLYLPINFKTGRNQPYAMINFKFQDAAEKFM